jgi:hypothetical protein
MDKAIILNVFDFVSFHVCKTLLEKGIEVKGIHVEDSEKEPFSEEKRLEVGRNANFEEYSLAAWANQEKRDTANAMIIFSLYDLFMLYKEAILQKETVTKPILDLMERSNSAAIILPSQMMTKSIDSQVYNDLQAFLEQAVGVRPNLQSFYLPAVYGPWQPETFLFQQSLLTKMNGIEEFKGVREGTMDAIYIDDAIESIFEIMSAGIQGSYLLESGRKKHWDKCAAFLNIDNNIVKSREMEQITSKTVKVTVKNISSISESFAKQMEHTKRLYSSQ